VLKYLERGKNVGVCSGLNVLNKTRVEIQSTLRSMGSSAHYGVGVGFREVDEVK
jgi:hypothetical protein